MTRLPIKRVLVGIIAAIMLAPQLTLPAMAATDGTVLAAAQSGVNYLAANQNADGSISGFGGESDWSVEAIQADGQQASSFSHGGTGSLLDFLKIDVPSAGTTTTAIERKIIAISATGQDATNFGGVNYAALLEGQHIGGQIGDTCLLNDDMFGVIAAAATKDPALYAEAQDGLNYLLANQQPDGGFGYNIATCPSFFGSDSSDTAAAIIAMQAATSLGLSNAGLATAKSSAEAYLLSTQQTDGGFAADVFSPPDGDSTAWDLMALNSLGSPFQTQALAARGWLLTNQNTDGGFSYGAFGYTTSDTYTTAHAVIALLGTTWLLQPAPLRGVATPPVSSGGSGGSPTPGASSSSSADPPATTNTTSSSGSSNGVAPGAEKPVASPDANPDAKPQVKGASTTSPSKPKGQRKTSPARDSHAYDIYAVALLGLAALIWFMLESRKASRRAIHGK